MLEGHASGEQLLVGGEADMVVIACGDDLVAFDPEIDQSICDAGGH